MVTRSNMHIYDGFANAGMAVIESCLNVFDSDGNIRPIYLTGRRQSGKSSLCTDYIVKLLRKPNQVIVLYSPSSYETIDKMIRMSLDGVPGIERIGLCQYVTKFNSILITPGVADSINGRSGMQSVTFIIDEPVPITKRDDILKNAWEMISPSTMGTQHAKYNCIITGTPSASINDIIKILLPPIFSHEPIVASLAIGNFKDMI